MDGGLTTKSSNNGMMQTSSVPAASSHISSTPGSPTSPRSFRKSFDPNTSTDNAPPYWTRAEHRTETVASFDSLAGRGITMADNTTDTSETNAACWAKSVTITDHSEVNGGALNVGAFVVWHITIETLNGSPMHIQKRYNDFLTLREHLTMTFPLSDASIPTLPPKGVVAKFRPNFLERRKKGLQYFLNCVVLNPEFSRAPVMKEFLFG